MDKAKKSSPDIWASQENLIRTLKLATMGLGGLVAALTIAIVCVSLRAPLVVVDKVSRHDFYVSAHQDIKLTNSDIESFTKEFLDALYVWSEFNADTLRASITPYVDVDMAQKIIDAQSSRYSKDLKGKKVEEALTFVKVDVLSDRVVCRIDRVLKIGGLPLVIPTELTLSMIQGHKTRVNPMGIYIVGVTEHEGAK
jgi:hypothetical protein